MEVGTSATACGSRMTRTGQFALSTGRGCDAGPEGQGCLAGRGSAAPRTAPPPAPIIPLVPPKAVDRADARGGQSNDVNSTRSPRDGAQRRLGADTVRHPDESPNIRARTAAWQATGNIGSPSSQRTPQGRPNESPNTRARAAARVTGEIERHPVESSSTWACTAAGRGGYGWTTTGQLASASQRGTVTDANLNIRTAPEAGQGGSHLLKAWINQIAIPGRGYGGQTTGQSLATASQRGQPITANLPEQNICSGCG